MSEVRPIDANALMERLERKKCEPAKVRYTEGYNDALMRFQSMVHGAPTVDAVPVRCKDCKWFRSGIDIDGKPFTRCNGSVRTYGQTTPDWFCADGERRSEDGKQ